MENDNGYMDTGDSYSKYVNKIKIMIMHDYAIWSNIFG